MGEILETTKLITEGDVQSWYTAWSATADLVLALAERTHDPRSKGGAYMRASTYQRTGEFLLPPDDPKRPEAFSKTSRYFFRGLDTLGVHYEYFAAPYENGSLRALNLPAPAGSEGKPVPRGVEHCPVADDEAHLLLIEPATPTTGDRSTAAQRIVI